MFLLRISFLVYVSVLLLTLTSCASINGGGAVGAGTATPKQDDAWNDVPKPYINGLKAAQKGQSKWAVKLFEQSISEFPKFAPAFTNLGLQQLRLKNRSAAEVNFKKSIEISPVNPVSYNHLGVIARLNGDFDSALTLYKKAIEQNSDYAIAHLNLGILLDLYLYDLEPALEQYEIYQSKLKKKDAKVSKWIIEIKRRIAKNNKS